MTNFSLVVFILQIVSSFGLKYLWNIMNLLQFLIYMQMWMIKLPPLTQTFLQELKAIAFMDFIPKEDIQNVIKEKLGLEEETSDDQMQVENSANSQELSIDRVGSKSLIDNMGTFLLIGILIILILILLGLFYFIQRCCASRLQKCY